MTTCTEKSVRDFLLGGTGIDGIMGDDGLLMTRRNDLMGEPLYGIAPRDPVEGPLKRNEEPNFNSLNVEITTPGNIQRAIINIENELIKQGRSLRVPHGRPGRSERGRIR